MEGVVDLVAPPCAEAKICAEAKSCLVPTFIGRSLLFLVRACSYTIQKYVRKKIKKSLPYC
ncbi:hypothetical protein CCP2SC5_130008 [Azospirillaceae bacterium]